MSTDLLFSNAMPRNPSTLIQSGKNGSCATSRLSKSKAADETLEIGNRSFVKTLRKVSQDQKATACGLKNCRTDSSDCKKLDPADEPDSTPAPALQKDDEISDTRSLPEDVETMGAIQAPFSPDFLAFINMLEKLGLHDSAGGMDFQNKTDVSADRWEDSAALLNILKSLRRSSNSVPSSDMTLELEHLRQLIAKALASKTSSPSAENTADGSYPSGEKSTDTTSLLTRLAAELENNSKDTGSQKHSEKSDVATPLENQQKGESAKLTTETATAGAEASDAAKKGTALNLTSTDASRLEDNSDIAGKKGAYGRSDSHSPNSFTFELGKRHGSDPVQEGRQSSESTPVSKMANDANVPKGLDYLHWHGRDSVQENKQGSEAALTSKMTGDANMKKSIDLLPQHSNEALQESASNNESTPVSRMIKEAQGTNENHLKMGPTIGSDVGSKINVADTGTSYNGLLNSESQAPEKALESLSTSKETEAGHHNLRTQALDQIVRKAVIQLGNGQHEAKIDLKPEYLGHVRMQVITENQHVIVKILAEFSFVKDLIENSAHQLKSDLQQQGLNVDKLEVSVSHDENQSKHAKEKADRSNARPGNVDQNDSDNSKGDDRLNIEHSREAYGGESTVDYFA